MRNQTLSDLVSRVSAYSIANPRERDCWEKAPAITGILAWGNDDDVEAVKRWLERAVDTQNSEGNLNFGDPLLLNPAGHVKSFTPTAVLTSSLGYPLLQLYQQTKDERYLQAAHRQAEALMNAPQTRDGGFWARKEAPELWVDMMYLMCPFLALYGVITGKEEFLDEAMRQYEIHAKRVVCPIENLARHAWCETPNHFPQSTFWARGNGWLVAGAVDLCALAENHPRKEAVADIGRRVLDAMASHQDASGFFHHILDDVRTDLEASATAMFAYSAARAVDLGIVDKDTYLPQALSAFQAVALSVEPDGAVPGVAVPPGGPGVPFGSAQFGQGFFLLAAHALRDRVAT